MSTIGSLSCNLSVEATNFLSENIKDNLYLYFALCLLDSEKEKLFESDPNAFLTAFLDDEDE
jgi:hypothetical protein